MIIGKQQFFQYQNMFYHKLQQTPHTIQLEIVEVRKSSGEFNMDEFVGDSHRESKVYTFNALYEKEISGRTREKYGLPKEVNGVIYLSPKQLVPILGDFHLNWNRTKVHFNGHVQVIDRIVYLEEMYGSCIGVQIFIKDSLKGG